MNNRKLIIGLIGLLIILPLAWWLGSPLFIDNAVSEADPFAVGEVEESPTLEPQPTAEPVQEVEEAMEESAEISPMLEPVQAEEMEESAETDEMTASADGVVTLSTAMFVDADSSHRGSGTATILQQGDRRVLRFTDFEVTNGPDLHVYLVNDTTGRREGDFGEYLDLGSLKGNVGDQNYEISADVDLSQFNGIIIYCQPFHVTFSIAEFSP